MEGRGSCEAGASSDWSIKGMCALPAPELGRPEP